MTIVRFIRLSTGKPITLEAQLGGGGEGKIYAVAEAPDLVAKVYHPDKVAPDRGLKLRVMYENPPDVSHLKYDPIAWPVDLLKSPKTSQIVGFLMRRVTQMRSLHEVYNPKTRREQLPFFDYYGLHRTARNLAAAVGILHAKGYVIGDVNESNILVSDRALIALVDTDSFQVRDQQRQVTYRCPVGKPEFTPAELQGERFDTIDRSPEHDLFGLGVLLFQLLMEGTHPFDGVYLNAGEPPPKETRIAAGHFPYNLHAPYRPKPLAPSIAILHPELQRLFWQCFVGGHINPKLRPDPLTWIHALRVAEAEFVSCAVNSQHRYGRHLKTCPWCDRMAQLGGRDPFPGKHSQPLAPIGSPIQQSVKSADKPSFQPAATRPRSNLPHASRTKAYRTRKPKLDWFGLLSQPMLLAIGAGLAIVGLPLIESLYSPWQQSQSEAIDPGTSSVFTTLEAEACLRQFSTWLQPGEIQRSLMLSQCKLDRAQQLAREGQLKPALDLLAEIPAHPDLDAEVQKWASEWSKSLLEVAAQEYDLGQFDVAVSLATSIPEIASVRLDAQTAIANWYKEWSANSSRLKAAQQARFGDRPEEAIQKLAQVTTTYWREQAQLLLDDIYTGEANRALSGDRLADAKAAAREISDPIRKQRLEVQIAQFERSQLMQKSDRTYLELAQKALYSGQFQTAKEAAIRVIGRDDGMKAIDILQKAESYDRLSNLLRDGQWDSASLMTRLRLISLLRDNFSCEEVGLIDRLWVSASQGQYGLSVQLRYKKQEGIIGQDSMTAAQQQQLNQIYPSRLHWGTDGATLDRKLRSCGY
jgi:serine/threonine protein kinase